MAQTQIDFRTGGNSAGFVVAGWAAPEVHGTWTNGAESRLSVGGLLPGAAYDVGIDLRPFVHGRKPHHQRVRVTVNGRLCHEARLTEPGRIGFAIPAGVIAADGAAELVFACPDAMSPHALSLSGDVRELGVSLRRLTLDGPEVATGTRRPAYPDAATIGEENGIFVFRARGHCPVCEQASEFVARRDSVVAPEWFPSWFRGELKCSVCGSIPRQRALFAVLAMLYPGWRRMAIHESSPGALGASPRLQKECPGYVATQYDPAIGFGNRHPTHDYRSEDLEAQTFGDASFDLVITQDVFEHLFAPDQAIREIARTLRPGGAHVMTVPIVNGAAPSRRRARREGDAIVHIAEAQYHGNPVSAKGSLVTVDWGWDIVEYLAAHSGLQVSMFQIDDLGRGIRAARIEVLVCRKPGPVPVL